MRVDKHFCARMLATAGLWVLGVSAFGPIPVHAQTSAGAAAQGQGPVRRLSIDDAVATALEQNLDLQVQRINPEIQASTISTFKANYTPTFTGQVDLVDQTQPPSSLLSGNTSQLTSGRTPNPICTNEVHGGSYYH